MPKSSLTFLVCHGANVVVSALHYTWLRLWFSSMHGCKDIKKTFYVLRPFRLRVLHRTIVNHTCKNTLALAAMIVK